MQKKGEPIQWGELKKKPQPQKVKQNMPLQVQSILLEVRIYIKNFKKHFKNEQRSSLRDAATKKRANTTGVEISNNYYE